MSPETEATSHGKDNGMVVGEREALGCGDGSEWGLGLSRTSRVSL